VKYVDTACTEAAFQRVSLILPTGEWGGFAVPIVPVVAPDWTEYYRRWEKAGVGVRTVELSNNFTVYS
jgi:hypothetical protein